MLQFIQMKGPVISVNQNQKQTQNITQKLSMHQIQTLNFLAMTGNDLREEILKAVNENPALEITKDPIKEQFKQNFSNSQSSLSQNDYQSILEQTENRKETLQEHLMSQLNLMHLTKDEYKICQSLIYNLDKNGFYGSMLDPVIFLDKSRPNQNQKMLDKCLHLIQAMDPAGTCCKTPEESLLVQAKLMDNPPAIALFLLDGKLELLNPPLPDVVQKKIKQWLKEWHSQSFAQKTPLDNMQISLEEVQEAVTFIKELNPFPAANYDYDSYAIQTNVPNIVLKIEKIDSANKNFSGDGLIQADDKNMLQVKYTSGIVPEIRLNPDYEKYRNKENQELIAKAKEFIQSLEYCKNTIAQQGMAIVRHQSDFFLKGPGNLKPLTHRQIATELGIHESTVSRMCSKKNSKYIQCQWGVFPASYFFSSSISTKNGNKLSSEQIRFKISRILSDPATVNISDNQLTQLLNEQGIMIARRTVAKYRSLLNIENSYSRK